MKREELTELKLLRKFLSYLEAAEPPVSRWKFLGTASTLAGAGLLTFVLISAYNTRTVTFGHVVTAAFSTACFFVGILFTSSAQQWPVFSTFLDRDRLRIRLRELETRKGEK